MKELTKKQLFIEMIDLETELRDTVNNFERDRILDRLKEIQSQLPLEDEIELRGLLCEVD